MDSSFQTRRGSVLDVAVFLRLARSSDTDDVKPARCDSACGPGVRAVDISTTRSIAQPNGSSDTGGLLDASEGQRRVDRRHSGPAPSPRKSPLEIMHVMAREAGGKLCRSIRPNYSEPIDTDRDYDDMDWVRNE